MSDSQVSVWTTESRTALRRLLMRWFSQNARQLPWRQTRDPYRIWVSEIMLQQTQVATVIPYYERFIAAFPDAAALAAAPEHEVLRRWEGLGYYRRARNLHAAAKRIVAEHGGEFPRDIEAARELPGIGRYTAGAILSIAHDDRHPILEANTVRLYSRLLAFDTDLTRSAAQKTLWTFATDILPRQSVGLFNQALMELGSLVCMPRQPRCDECPLQSLCPTRAMGAQERIPQVARKMRYEEVTETAIVVRKGSRVLVRQCGPEERWAGLWDFPRFPAPSAVDDQVPDEVEDLRRRTREITGVDIELAGELAVIKHGVTRFRITLRCREATTVRSPKQLPESVRWVTREELDELPLSVTGRQLATVAFAKVAFAKVAFAKVAFASGKEISSAHPTPPTAEN
jgi:A/G-specific adenine glycosylase